MRQNQHHRPFLFIITWMVYCFFFFFSFYICSSIGWDLSYEVYGFYQTLCPPNLLWLLLPKWGAQTFYSLFFHKLIFNMQGSKHLWVHLNKRIISYLFMTNSEQIEEQRHISDNLDNSVKKRYSWKQCTQLFHMSGVRECASQCLRSSAFAA